MGLDDPEPRRHLGDPVFVGATEIFSRPADRQRLDLDAGREGRCTGFERRGKRREPTRRQRNELEARVRGETDAIDCGKASCEDRCRPVGLGVLTNDVLPEVCRVAVRKLDSTPVALIAALMSSNVTIGLLTAPLVGACRSPNGYSMTGGFLILIWVESRRKTLALWCRVCKTPTSQTDAFACFTRIH